MNRTNLVSQIRAYIGASETTSCAYSVKNVFMKKGAVTIWFMYICGVSRIAYAVYVYGGMYMDWKKKTHTAAHMHTHWSEYGLLLICCVSPSFCIWRWWNPHHMCIWINFVDLNTFSNISLSTILLDFQ